jgi:hypothetical protein
MKCIISYLAVLFCTQTYECTPNSPSKNLNDNWENITIDIEQKNREVTLESLQIEASGLILKLITPKLDDTNCPLYENLKHFEDALQELATCYQGGSRGFTSYNKNLMAQHKAQMLPTTAVTMQEFKKVVDKAITKK